MQNKSCFDLADQEFNLNMKAAKVLASKLNEKEKKIALGWMKKLSNIMSKDLKIKKYRNYFMKRLLEVMKQSVVVRFLEHPKSKEFSECEKKQIKEEVCRVNESFALPILDSIFVEMTKSSTYTYMWSKDRRTYVAAKPIPGGGALVYMAVSEKPELGWIFPTNDDLLN